MIAGEPLVEAELASRPVFRTLVYLAVIGGVLGLAALRNRKPVTEVTQ